MIKPGRWILAALVLVGLGWYGWGRRHSGDASPRDGGARNAIARVVADTTRIRVEVFNGTGVRGLARRGTTAMRDAGFDVVGTGNWDAKVDSSIVLVRTGRMEWGALAVKALGGARIEVRPDSLRYVDLTVVLGARWRPPALPFDP